MRRLLLLTLLSLATTSGCSRHERPNDDCAPSGRVVDPVLLAFLSQARSAHHLADQQEAAGDSAAALRALQTLVAAPQPPGNPPEVGEVLADTRARMADLLSRAGRFDQADAAISEGLTSAKEPSYFRGHLLEVKGLVEERRAKALTSTGRGAEAEKARERSLSAYEEDMKIQAEVIRRATPAASGERLP
jgi:tetratricopeptide (TPR) repeat protein